MRKLLIIVICVLGMAFTQDTKSDLKQQIIEVVGVENIVYDVNVNVLNNNPTIYPNEPLCSSNNVGGVNYVVYEYNGQWYYGMYDGSGYAEVPVTEQFARKYCKGQSLGDI